MMSLAGSDIWLTWSGGLPDGQPFAGGGVAAFVITAVGTDVASVDPVLFVARTRNRTALPTSADVSLYSREVAPLMLAQLPPFLSQRRHW
jgi:hypothetical protein